jgi:hypothetical protein
MTKSISAKTEPPIAPENLLEDLPVENMVSKPPEVEDNVTLYLGDTAISKIVLDKSERHSDTSVENTYVFDCTKTPTAVYEKALTSPLSINKIISATLATTKIGLDSKRTITVNFLTAA